MKRRIHRSWSCSLVAGVHLCAASLAAAAPPCDVLILNGKVVDGSGNPWSYGDVAIIGDRIGAIGQIAGEAKRVIDATGLIVAPGFIDAHSHSDWVLFDDGDAQSKIRQGVTTEVIGESSSAGPFQDKLEPRTVSVCGEAVPIRRLADSRQQRSGQHHPAVGP